MDYQNIINQADTLAVADAIGISMETHSQNTHILCPGHKKHCGHEDQHFGSCVLTEHGYYCFAAQHGANVIKMVQEQAELNGNYMSYDDAARFVADVCHIDDDFQNINSDIAAKKIGLPFTDVELELIGCKKYPKHDIVYSEQVLDDGETIGLYQRTSQNQYQIAPSLIHKYGLSNISWDLFYQQNPRKCIEIISENALKCFEQAKYCLQTIYQQPYLFVVCHLQINYEVLLNELQQQINDLQKLINKCQRLLDRTQI